MLPPPLPGSSPSPLNGIRDRLGAPPRKLGWFEKPPIAYGKPDWLKANPNDQLNQIFGEFDLLWKRGIVVWAHVVMANASIYEPGQEDCPGEILYSLTEDDSVAATRLPQFSDRLFDLKLAETPDESWTVREREIAEDLASEMAWHAGFRLPDHWDKSSAEYRLNTILFHRAHLPGGVLTFQLLPLLILPEPRYHSVVVPQKFWTDEVFAFLKPYSGTADANDSLGKWRLEREAAYREVFGAIESVLHETELRHAHVDIYEVAPRDGRNFWTFVSGGMSEMAQPRGDGFCPPRAELVLYSNVRTTELGELVRNTAHYPFETGQALGHGHTVSVEQMSSQIFGNDCFPAILFVAAVRPDDEAIVGKVIIEGDPLSPLMMIPLTHSEFRFFRSSGLEAFMEAVRKSSNSIVFHPDRKSVV